MPNKFINPSGYGAQSVVGGTEFGGPVNRGPGSNFRAHQETVGMGYSRMGGGYQPSFNQPGGGSGYQPSIGAGGGWRKAAPLPAVGADKKSGGAVNYGPGQRRTDWTSK